MAPNTLQDLKNLLFNYFHSENFLGVSHSFDPNVNFFSSVPRLLTKHFSIGNRTVELNSSEKKCFLEFTLKYNQLEQEILKIGNILIQTWLRFSNYLHH